MSMYLLADTHVHLYPCYDFSLAIAHSLRNLQKIAFANRIGPQQFIPGLILTETSDCHYYCRLRQGANIFGSSSKIVEASDSYVSISSKLADSDLVLFPGRQICTTEGIELLALLKDVDIPDGLPLLETLSQIRSLGAIPVLNWGLGKWLGQRGHIISRLLAEEQTDPIILADTSMRPWFWFDKSLHHAHSCKLPVIAGSDPFRLPGEERLIGSYGILSNIQVTIESLPNDIKSIISNSQLFKIVGHRSSSISIISREAKLMRAKRF